MAGLWTHLKNERQEETVRLAEIEAAREERPLTEEEAVERALLRVRTGDEADALPILRELLAAYPENASALYLLGERLVDLDEPEGVPILEEAARRNADLRIPIQRDLMAFHARQGDHAAVASLREQATGEMDRQAIAEAASPLFLSDDLQTVDLLPDERSRLMANLSAVKGLGRAYAVRKRLPGTGEMREYLFLIPRRKLFEREDEADRLIKGMFESGVDLVRPFTIATHKSVKPWIKKLDAIPGALVFDAKAK